MTDKFNGFSQEEINRVSGTKHNKKTITSAAMEAKRPAKLRGHGGIRRVPDKCESTRQVKKMQATNNFTATSNKNLADKLKAIEADDMAMEEINLDRSMSKSIEEALFYQPLRSTQLKTESKRQAVTNTITSTNSASPTASNTSRSKQTKNDADSQSTSSSSSTVPGSNDSSILKLNSNDDSRVSSSNGMDHNESSILPSPSTADAKAAPPLHQYTEPISHNVESPFRGISLKDFETHRKMIEEQNRQKKDLLYKVIEQHSQKTAAEARKIEEIKAELSKLDNDLAVDVAVLRKHIETACIHFATVEKQYMKIESQFLKAKMDLHNAAEKKELLTEHLCTVIAHNEDRKAQKLSELMEKVGLASANGGDYEAPSSTSN